LPTYCQRIPRNLLTISVLAGVTPRHVGACAVLQVEARRLVRGVVRVHADPVVGEVVDGVGLLCRIAVLVVGVLLDEAGGAFDFCQAAVDGVRVGPEDGAAFFGLEDEVTIGVVGVRDV